MIRNLKVLGLAIFAVLAMSAVAASAASAEGIFTAEEYPATLTGEQVGTDVFTTNAGTVSCTHATYHGEEAGPVNSTTVAPTYTGCRAFGLFNATIDMNGCEYEFTTPETEGPDTYIGDVDIVCPGAAEIAVTTSVCRVTVPAQNDLGTITYENTAGSPDDVDVTVNISNQIKYTVDPGCATTGAGTFTNGSYTGSATVDADNEEGTTIGVSISD